MTRFARTPSREPSSDLPARPGLTLTPQGLPTTGTTGMTGNPRVRAAGNAAQSHHMFAEAMASGTSGMSLVKAVLLGH